MTTQYVKTLKSTAYRRWLEYNFFGETERGHIMDLKKTPDIHYLTRAL